MKRSEAITIVKQVLSYHGIHTFDVVAKDVLYALEEAGMKPPYWDAPHCGEAEDCMYWEEENDR